MHPSVDHAPPPPRIVHGRIAAVIELAEQINLDMQGCMTQLERARMLQPALHFVASEAWFRRILGPVLGLGLLQMRAGVLRGQPKEQEYL